MSVIYSVDLIFKPRQIDSVIRDLQDILTHKRSKKLAKISTWQPEQSKRIKEDKLIYSGIKGAKVDLDDNVNSYCFSIKLPFTAEYNHILDEFEIKNGLGCMWTSLFMGEHWGLMTMRTTGSSMTQTLISVPVLDFVSENMSSSCEVILLAKEGQECEVFYPLKTHLTINRYDDKYFNEEYFDGYDFESYSSDAYNLVTDRSNLDRT